MNSPDGFNSGSPLGDADRTLRLMAGLPAPEGLEDRIHAKLRNAPRSGFRAGRILQWPAGLRSTGQWIRSSAMRGAAAAAIVFVVAGGGWGIYTRVQPNKVIVMPARMGSQGFSGAKAMRTPDPFAAPRVAVPAAVPAPVPDRSNAPIKVVAMPVHPARAARPGKANRAALPAAPPAQ